MRPITLTMAGLRSYRSARTLEFGDPGLVAITGDTGVGKSSILEGIAGALYGSCTWEGRGLGQLIADGIHTLQLELIFTVGGQTWTVSRSASRTPYPPARHHLQCHDTGERLDGADSVTQRIEQLIGLDRKQFLRTVVLPQNRFMELLAAPRTERNSILKGIFRLDDLDAVRGTADSLLDTLDPRLTEAKVARARLTADPQAAAAEAQQRLHLAEQTLAQLRNVRTAVDEHVAAAAAARQQARLLTSVKDPFQLARDAAATTPGTLHSAADAAHELAAAEHALAEQRNTAAAQVIDAQQHLDAAATRGEDVGSLGEAAQALASLGTALPELIRDRARLADDDEVLSAEMMEHEQRKAEHSAKTTQFSEAEGALQPLVDAAELAQATVDDAARAIAALRDARALTVTAAAAVDQRRSQLAEMRAAARTAAREVTIAEAEAEAADAELRALRRRNAAAHAAEHSHPGDPCPVCARALPDDFTAPTMAGDDTANRTATKRRHTANELRQGATVAGERAMRAADQLVTALREEVDALTALANAAARTAKTLQLHQSRPAKRLAMLDPATAQAALIAPDITAEPACILAIAEHLAEDPSLDSAEPGSAARAAALPLVAAVDAALAADTDALLAPQSQLAYDAHGRRKRAEEALADLRDAVTRLAGHLPVEARELAGKRFALRLRRDRLVTDVHASAATLAALPALIHDLVADAVGLANVPRAELAPAAAVSADTPAAPHKVRDTVPLPTSPPDVIAAVIRQANDRLQAARDTLTRWDRQRQEAQDEMERLRDSERALIRRHQLTVSGPVRQALTTLGPVHTRAVDLLDGLDAVVTDMRVAGLNVSGLPEKTPAARIELVEPSELTAETILALSGQARTMLAAVGVLVDAAESCVTRLTSHAEGEEQSLRRLLGERGFADVDGLRQAEINAASAHQIATTDLRRYRAEQPVAAALDAGITDAETAIAVLRAVKGALSSVRFVDFVIARRAAALLRVASALLGQLTLNAYGFAEDFRIVDRRTGTQRDAKTLSGGETFLASLALALALVELAGRGGGRIESLFLDEGFGSLDATVLAEALDVLRDHVSSGRLVVVISHLHAVAADLERVLLVTKDPTGSDMRWLEAAERERLLLEDVSAGLLT